MLCVWLPLISDTKNQGLSELSITSGTPVFKNTGKLSNKSLDLSSRIVFNCPDLANVTEFSISFWAKVNSDTNLSTNWVDIFNVYDQKEDGTNGNLRWETCYASGLATRGISSHDNATYAISSLAAITGTYPVTVKDTWEHRAFTVNKDGCSEYVNGELKATYAYNGGHITGRFHIGETNLINGEICDVRIWDNCISPQQIKRLSQGLVLHYRLSGVGGENLLIPQIKDVKWSNWQASSDWTSSNTREKVVINGKTWAHIIQNSSTGYGGYDCEPGYNGIVIDPAKTYTWSCLAKAGANTNAEIVLWCHWRSTEGGSNLSQAIKKIQLTSNPTRIYWNIPKYAHDTYTVNRINLNMGTYGTANNEIYFTDVKFEEGNKATPWYPNPSDPEYSLMGFDDNVEWDRSGFGNNGTKVGGIGWSGDSARYTGSYEFDGESSAIQVPFDSVAWQTNFTLNLWFKKNDLGTKSYETLFGGPSGFEIDTRSGSSTTLSLYMTSIRGGDLYSPFNFGEWYMLTLVNDGTNEHYYVNGELVKTIAVRSMPSGSYYIGAWRTAIEQNYKGLISDFRIYATALSAEDVLSLYNLGGSLDSSGTFHTYEYVEG